MESLDRVICSFSPAVLYQVLFVYQLAEPYFVNEEIMDVLLELNQEQRLTFILVTHDRAVGARCERIIRMRDGLVEEEQPVKLQEH